MKTATLQSVSRHLPIQRPTWLPSYIPELQGLRGLAVLAVVFYHCHPRLEGTWVHYASLWGWAGVNLFFVLSGFLITSILLESRSKEKYFRNFYGRRALRIWPVYVLVLIVVYLNAPWFIGPTISAAIKSAPWLAYIFFVQNLFHLTVPPAIGPTWSLAIEEQYYFLWAPMVRFLRAPWMLAAALVAALVGSPLLRLANLHWMTLTHTLIHLDGIALGSLIALERIADSDNWWLHVELPREIEKYTVSKGSISIEGISLTVAKLAGGTCTVAIIPHTVEVTNLNSLQPGDPVNLEADLIAKYVEKMMTGEAAENSLTVEELVRQGF